MSEEYPSINLEGLYEYLKRYSLSDSLFVIGAVSSTLKGGFDILNTENIPPQTIDWVNRQCKDRHKRVELALHLSRLTRLLLLSPSNDYKNEVMETHDGTLQNSIYQISILHEPKVDKLESLADAGRIFARISQQQFPIQLSRLNLVGRGQMLFLDIPSEVKTAYDFNAKCLEYFGMDIFQFLATGHSLWVTANGVLKYNMTIEIDALKNVVTPEVVNRFVALSSGTPEDYRRSVRGDDWKTSNPPLDLYGFDPLSLMPAIKVGHSVRLPENTYVVPQPLFWLQRASVGLFYLLGDKEREISLSLGQEGRNDFRQSFGDIYRAYVGKHLYAASDRTIFIDLDKEISFSGNKPDFALIEDDTCALFEVKTALLTLDIRSNFDPEKTKVAVQSGKFEKAITQLNSFEDAVRSNKIKDKRFNNVSKFIKIIVGFEDVYLANAVLLPLLREVYGDGKITNFQIATITDIEHMGTMLAQGGRLVSFLLKKIKTNEAEYALSPVIQNALPDGGKANPILEKAFMAFWDRMTGGAPFRDKA